MESVMESISDMGITMFCIMMGVALMYYFNGGNKND